MIDASSSLSPGFEAKVDGVGGIHLIIKKILDDGVVYTKRRADSLVETTKEHARAAVSTTSYVVYNTLVTLLTVALIISLSIFMYGTFYFAYMPLQIHEEPVNLQFVPCTEQIGICSFPNASVDLNTKIKLMTGQPYSISLLLEVPDSPNNQELGMFMSCIHMQRTVKDISFSCKSSILEFKSSLLRTIETLVFSPFLLSGTSTQRQWVRIDYYSKYLDDPHIPATSVFIQIHSKFIQVYRTRLVIHAEFSGLRHIMYNYPAISTVIGVFSNIVLLTIIILVSWTRFFSQDFKFNHLDSGLVGEISRDKDDIEILKKSDKEGLENTNLIENIK